MKKVFPKIKINNYSKKLKESSLWKKNTFWKTQFEIQNMYNLPKKESIFDICETIFLFGKIQISKKFGRKL